MKKIFFLCVAALVGSNAFAQYDANWVFGDSAGLYFHDGITESFTTSILSTEACASIADITGIFQFYTNGERVWNRNHVLMPNGDGLQIGGVGDYGSSITQGVMILPAPGSQTLYYIFQLQHFLDSGMLYSTVDMSLSGGLGDVVEKNVSLYNLDVTEKLQAVKHANGRDWWIVTRAKPHFDVSDDSTYIFVTYLLTPTGFEGPFEQVYGPKYTFENSTDAGQMVFNRAGNKLAYAGTYYLDIYDFDRCTGAFSNMLHIFVNEPKGIYGAAFSPDGSRIYVGASCGNRLYQYCLTCDEAPIDSSQILVFQNPFGSNYCFGQLLLGPDGKMYFAIGRSIIPSEEFSDVNQHLSVINNPNLPCPDCDFDTLTVSLGDRRVIFGLPNMPNYNLGALVGSGCDTLTAIADMAPFSMQLYPNPAAHSVSISMPAMPITIRLQTMLGTTLYTQQVATGHAVIPLQDFPQGIYIVSLEVNHIIMATQKLILQR